MNLMSNLADYYSRPLEITDGDGCYLFDTKGKRYVDFLAGWCVGNIGWKNKKVRKAIEKEAARGTYVPPVFRRKEWEEFAELLVSKAPNKKLTRAFRCTSGSEAVEFALKCARAATGKGTIVSVDGVYHGHTYGAAAVGDACTKSMAPCPHGFLKLPMPNESRGVSAKKVVQEFEKMVRENNDIAAFLSEPVWTNAGSYIPPKDFYPAIERLCRKNGILFIMDEVATGFGRCGKMFASELWGVKPDMLCLGKGLTGGYGTMGATLVTEPIFKASRDIPFYSTFGWNALDLAAAQANSEVILKEKLWENAEEVGEYLLEKLKPLEALPYVSEVRGIGLLLGIEIVKDKRSKAPDWARSQKIQDQCAEEGLILETAGHTLFITPPLTLTRRIVDEGVKILNEVML